MKNLLKGTTILIAEDDPDLLMMLSDLIQMFGAKTITAENGTVAMEKYLSHQIDVVVSDIKMPGGDGIEFLEKLRARDKDFPPFFFLTGFSDLTPVEAVKMGAQGMLLKPINPQALAQAVASILVERARRNAG